MSYDTMRTIDWDDKKSCITIIDQTALPARLVLKDICNIRRPAGGDPDAAGPGSARAGSSRRLRRGLAGEDDPAYVVPQFYY